MRCDRSLHRRLDHLLVVKQEALGISSLGVERDLTYYHMSLEAIPQLASLSVETKQSAPPSQLTAF
jgi:hypothetical protein